GKGGMGVVLGVAGGAGARLGRIRRQPPGQLLLDGSLVLAVLAFVEEAQDLDGARPVARDRVGRLAAFELAALAVELDLLDRLDEELLLALELGAPPVRELAVVVRADAEIEGLHRANEEIPGGEDRQPAEAEKHRPCRRAEGVEAQAHDGEGDDRERRADEEGAAHHSASSSSSSSWSSYF